MLEHSPAWLKTVYKYVYRQKLAEIKLSEQFRRISNDDLESFDIDGIVSSSDKKPGDEKFDIRKYERFAGGKGKVIRSKK